jgi:rubredoxin
MKYHCTWCGYIYDEIKWDEDMWIYPLTFFENLPNDFFCPFCDTHKDDFVALEESVNYISDPNKLTAPEAEHYPIIEIDWDKLFYSIWQIEHPSEDDHFVYEVAIFDSSWDLIEKKHFYPWDELKWTFDIEYLDEFEIRIYCSRDWVFSTWLFKR